MTGFVLWFTGLSGSGKSTLTAMVASELRRRSVHVETLDGDEIRRHLSKGLGFSQEDRDTNIRRIGFVAKLIARSGGCAIAAAISPYKEIRNELRRSIDRFVEVYTECPIEVLSDRDPKGLYKKALAGEIKNFTGVDDPYQAPDAPEVHLRTDREPPEASLQQILRQLEELGYIPKADPAAPIATRAGQSAALVLPHGSDLVDRILHGDRALEARERAQTLPAALLDPRAQHDLACLATGAYSPLNGFMQNRDYLRVVRASRLERGLPWSLPVTLAVPSEIERTVKQSAELALRSADGELLGLLNVQDVWRPDKAEEAARVLGTQSSDDPGVRALKARGDIYVGGEIRCFEAPAGRWPTETRDYFRRRAWSTVTALASEWLPLRPEEYLARIGLQFADGLLLLAVDGARSSTPLEQRAHCHQLVLDRYFARGKTHVVPCPLPVHATEARLAILRAIVAKNYGASTIVLSDPDGSLGTRIRQSVTEAELGVTLHVAPPAGYSELLGELATQQTAGGDLAAVDLATLDAAVARGDRVDQRYVRAEVVEAVRGV